MHSEKVICIRREVSMSWLRVERRRAICATCATCLEWLRIERRRAIGATCTTCLETTSWTAAVRTASACKARAKAVCKTLLNRHGLLSRLAALRLNRR